MVKPSYFLLLGILLSSMISCKKDSSSTGSSGIDGNYKFVSLQSQTSSTAQFSDGVSNYNSLTTSNYTTTNNTGTIAIGNNTMTGNGIGYSINSTATTYEYIDNVLFDSLSSPFNVTIPPVSSVSSFKLIGTDSIYFSGGFMSGAGGSNMASVPSGGRYKMVGGTLTLTLNFAKDTVDASSGFPVHQHESGTAIATMQKQ
jgi:hypothetical protein